VTKSGEIAGPRVLEHIVDVVLYMEVGTLLPSLFWIVGQFGTWSCYSLLFFVFSFICIVYFWILCILHILN
jgi:hypothetical protein